MIVRPIILSTTVTIGAMSGWWAGSAGGIMVSYFVAVAGASAGIFIGRKIQRHLGL